MKRKLIAATFAALISVTSVAAVAAPAQARVFSWNE